MKKVILFLILSSSLYGIDFKYSFDNDYRFEAVVTQNVKKNNEIILSSVIENRYIVKILEKSSNKAKLLVTQAVFQDSAGLAQGYFINHERESGEIYQDIRGNITPITNTYFPTVQSVPSFPDRDISIGDSWTSYGKDHFDLRNSFFIDQTITANFLVFYKYLENKYIDGTKVAVINIEYWISENIPLSLETAHYYPKKLTGSFKQKLFWDIDEGRPHSVEGNYAFEFFLTNGDTYQFKGGNSSKSWPKNDLKSSSFKKLVENLESTPNTSVEEDEEQVRITFQSLLFGPESWYLKESVKDYLDSIGVRLKDFKDINIKINGHTALLPDTDENYVKNLSLKRALAVADYLVSKGYISKRNIEVIGSGGDFPVDTNSTKEGREKNRRVEIDILKN